MFEAVIYGLPKGPKVGGVDQSGITEPNTPQWNRGRRSAVGRSTIWPAANIEVARGVSVDVAVGSTGARSTATVPRARRRDRESEPMRQAALMRGRPSLAGSE